MKAPLIGSALLHIGVIVAITVGLPSVKPPPPPVITPIVITSITEIAEEATAPEPEPAKPPPPKDTPKAAPKMTADQAPDLSKVPLPKPPEEEAPPPEEQAEAVPLRNAPAPPKPPPRRPKPKAELTKRAPQQQPEEDAFSSLLKNLTPDASEERAPPQDVPLAERLNISEIQAVHAQLAGCWNILSGAQMAEDIVVRVKLFMNPDRTIRKAVIVDELRYTTDIIFRAAADSAMRALRNPNCSPLLLPEDKYDQWKTTIINFDPRAML